MLAALLVELRFVKRFLVSRIGITPILALGTGCL
jgi:hypothetical protein